MGGEPACTNPLLIDEPPMVFLSSLAVRIGLNEAIFLQKLHFLLKQRRHLFDGRSWVHNTYDEWHEQLPFWSVSTIRRTVANLETAERDEAGNVIRPPLVIGSDDYNRFPMDKTKWYTIDYDALHSLYGSPRPEGGQVQHSQSVQNEQTAIPRSAQNEQATSVEIGSSLEL